MEQSSALRRGRRNIGEEVGDVSTGKFQEVDFIIIFQPAIADSDFLLLPSQRKIFSIIQTFSLSASVAVDGWVVDDATVRIAWDVKLRMQREGFP